MKWLSRYGRNGSRRAGPAEWALGFGAQRTENAQRGVVVGRKNWLFCDTPKGSEASVIAYSILETAKANGLNPEKYLMHIFTALPDRFAKNPNADIEDLLPWNDKIMELCKLGV